MGFRFQKTGSTLTSHTSTRFPTHFADGRDFSVLGKEMLFVFFVWQLIPYHILFNAPLVLVPPVSSVYALSIFVLDACFHVLANVKRKRVRWLWEVDVFNVFWSV